MEPTWEEHGPVVERLLGGAVGEAVDLGGSSRTVVWRVRSDEASYVVKVHREEEAEGYARECSALEALTGSGALPDLVGHDDATRTIVMQDLGAGAHLADALLGDDRPLASRRLLAWVDALSRLHGAATGERVSAFEAAAARRGGVVRTSPEELAGPALEQYAAHLPGLPVDEVREALGGVTGLLSDDVVVSPGDVCPDNNAAVGERLVLLDLEGAQLLHPAWDLAYLTVPWPSCWCSWAVPEAEVARALARYGGRVSPDDLAVTTLVWSVVSPGWFLPRALGDDHAGTDPRVPGRRAMVLHRLARAAASEAPSPLAPLVDLAARAHDALRARWGDVPLPLGPVWRATTLAP
ncbi:phosphotransferase family protein [Nocardioides marmoraquaticus]